MCHYNGKDIIALNGMHTGKLGVITVTGKPVTSIERTLIDIAVRPAYAGGANEVLSAFINAKDQVDVDSLVSMLDGINYTYPYYQSIGFYLEQAGYDTPHIAQLQQREQFIDFYLDYEIHAPAYSEKWRSFYPKEFAK